MADEALVALVLIVVAPCAAITTLGTAGMHRSTALRAAAPSPAQAARLMRIEHAVDAIAVEVEHVSENQRSATRRSNERADRAPSIASDREVTHAR